METPKNLEELLRYTAAEQQRKQADQLAEAHYKFVASSFDKAAAYTTVVVFGGYAGLFGVWQLSKDHLTGWQSAMVALLTLTSVAIFLTFEIVKVAVIGRKVFSQIRVLQDSAARQSGGHLLAALQKLDQASAEGLAQVRWFWLTCLSLAATTAFLAFAILGVNLVIALLPK